MVRFVALLEPAKNVDGRFDRRLLDHHRLEAALQRGVFLDVLAVLIEGRSADGSQFAPGQRGLEHVGRVHGTLGRSRADQGVQLVDEQDDLTLRIADLLQDGFQAVLELAAVLRASHHAGEIEGDEPLVAQRFWDVAGGDALRNTLGNGGLAHAGLADEHRVVLGAAAEHLHHAPDFLVATDHRVDLLLLGQRREVASVLVERLELALGLLISDALAATDLLHGFEQLVVAGAIALEQGLKVRVAGGCGQYEVLDGNVVVLQALGFVFGLGDQRHGASPHAGATPPGDLRQSLELLLE